MHTASGATPLTVAEALMLLDPNKSQGHSALKLTLLEFLVRRLVFLRHESRKGFLGFGRKADYLSLVAEPAWEGVHKAHIRAVLDILVAAGARGAGATIKAVVWQARRWFWSDFSAFQTHYVLPVLVELGLVHAYQYGVLSWTRYRHTPAGLVARHQVERRMIVARRIPTVLDNDPFQAAVLAAVAGVGVWLVDELQPYYKRLSAAMRQAAETRADVVIDAIVEACAHVGMDAAFDTLTGIDWSGAWDVLEMGTEMFDAGCFELFDAAWEACYDSGDVSSGEDAEDGGDGDSGDGGSNSWAVQRRMRCANTGGGQRHAGGGKGRLFFLYFSPAITMGVPYSL